MFSDLIEITLYILFVFAVIAFTAIKIRSSRYIKTRRINIPLPSNPVQDRTNTCSNSLDQNLCFELPSISEQCSKYSSLSPFDLQEIYFAQYIMKHSSPSALRYRGLDPWPPAPDICR